jgi:hypothetical protein
MLVAKRLQQQLDFTEGGIRLNALEPIGKSPFKQPVDCTIRRTLELNRANHEARYALEQYGAQCRVSEKRVWLDYVLTASSAKLKDIGKYRRYAFDRRIPGLLLWKHAPNTNGGDPIQFDTLQKEIDAYDILKKSMAVQLFELERTAVKTFGLGHPDQHLPFSVVVETLQSKGILSKEQGDAVGAVRNAMNHNQFPLRLLLLDQAVGDSVAGKMNAFLKEYVPDWIKKTEERRGEPE